LFTEPRDLARNKQIRKLLESKEPVVKNEIINKSELNFVSTDIEIDALLAAAAEPQPGQGSEHISGIDALLAAAVEVDRSQPSTQIYEIQENNYRSGKGM